MIKATEINCSGCRACENVCPTHCISFLQNKNGFLIPYVDVDLCVKCGLCEKTCPIHSGIDRFQVKKVYAAYAVRKEAVNSTSGGIFYILSDSFIVKGGIVFGAAYDSLFNLQIREARNREDLIRLQGSKYFQADTADTYETVKQHLGRGKKVLYSGTPCQIAGLRNALEKTDVKNLLTIEIICHGVPSPLMFKDYIKWLEAKKKKQISSYQFRTKKISKRDFQCLIRYTDGNEEIISGFRDPFYKKFMASVTCREICYECPFAQKNRVADITLGDFWNIEDLDICFGKKSRVSVVLLNTKAGEKAWNEIIDSIIARETDWKLVVKGNGNLQSATLKPDNYFAYGDIENKYEFFEAVFKEKRNKKKEIFNRLPVILRRVLKKVL
jgi:coenzyme F420-reducing hydrogenase beta subunit